MRNPHILSKHCNASRKETSRSHQTFSRNSRTINSNTNPADSKGTQNIVRELEVDADSPPDTRHQGQWEDRCHHQRTPFPANWEKVGHTRNLYNPCRGRRDCTQINTRGRRDQGGARGGEPITTRTKTSSKDIKYNWEW